MPQYQKEIQMYLNHMHIVEDCQKHYSKHVEKLCKGVFSATNDRQNGPMRAFQENFHYK